ncbi:type II toxin-antitoxin system RelE/ParE family toxin [Microbulbifer sp.]|uniref:type II toxin-antitoxin system RelE/ParE family toxin n=1 Tax=Microbulbifer sp. TaxID=1908541 RepID=UPI003F2AA565
MIKSIKHKGLRKFYETGNTGGIRSDHAQRLRLRLTKLDAIVSLDDITLKNWDLHPLKGDKAGQWAIKVSGNWRLFFKFENGHVYLLDYDDYH